MSEHTPAPWTVRESISGGFYVQKDGRGIWNDVGVCSEEEAKFIVRAVNSHEALIKAAKYVLEYMGTDGGYGNVKTSLEKAVAQAEGYK